MLYKIGAKVRINFIIIVIYYGFYLYMRENP